MTNLSWLRMLDKIGAIVRQHGPLLAASEHKQTILELLKQYEPRESDYRPYIHFDASGYTKNLVRELGQDECNVIIMCWAARQASAFHAHEGSRCFVKILAGQLREQQVPYPGELDKDHNKPDARASQDRVLNANDVTYIDDSIGCHRVSNLSSSKPAITLHVYMPAYKECRIFEETNHSPVSLALSKSRSLKVTFDSVGGQPIQG